MCVAYIYIYIYIYSILVIHIVMLQFADFDHLYTWVHGIVTIK